MSSSWCEVEEFSENVIYYLDQSDRKKDYFGDIVALLFQLPKCQKSVRFKML